MVAVHAHPDDESSKGAASMAKYASVGVRTVLVTCTDGAAGGMRADAGGSGDGLVAIRARELAAAASILGYSATYQLGFSDSGMGCENPSGFATVDVGQVAEHVRAVLDDEQPDVVVTYDADYAAGHPDHGHAHDAAVLAFGAYSRGRHAKLYGIRTHTATRLMTMHRWLTANDIASPYEAALGSVGPDLTTTRIEVTGYVAIARRALRAHRSQVGPEEPWFFAVPTEVLEVIYPWDEYQRLDPPYVRTGSSGYETDLFADLP